MKFIIITISLFIGNSIIGYSQNNSQFKCPRNIKTKSPPGYYFEEPGKAFVTVGAGYLFCYPYLNKNKKTDKYYAISSKPKFYATFFYRKPITKRTDFFCGIQITQNQQGLILQYQSEDLKVKETAYAVSQLFRIPIGLSYKVTPSFHVGAGMAFTYSAHLFNTYSGGVSGSSSNLVGYNYNWDDGFEDDKYYLGIDILANKHLYKRLSLNFQFSLDLRTSVATSGNASLKFNNGNIEAISAYTKPQLMYGSLGISYRFF